MKNIIISICILICSCKNSQNVTQADNKGILFKIIKIESINDWQIIYATKKDSIFKIVSKKENGINSDCNKIRKGQYYDFKLHSRKENPPEINGVKISPVNSIDITCYAFDKQTNVCIEPKKGIFDLYFAENLKGLCLEKQSN